MGAEPPKDTSTCVSHASMKGGTNVIFRNYMWTTSFPPSFCNDVFLISLNTVSVPFQFVKPTQTRWEAKKLITTCWHIYKEKKQKREEYTIRGFAICSKMKRLVNKKMVFTIDLIWNGGDPFHLLTGCDIFQPMKSIIIFSKLYIHHIAMHLEV